MATVKVKKKRFNVKKFLILFLFFYMLIYTVVFLFNEPIRHIKIKGNNLVSDALILEKSKLKNYPSIFKYFSNTLEKRIEKIDLIEKAQVKKKWGFVVEIIVEENKPLFYNNSMSQIYLSNKSIISDTNIVGIPTLLSTLDDDMLNKFIERFKSVDSNIIYEINEIYFEPSYNEKEEIIDGERFRFLMSDGNQVYVTLENEDSIKRLNYYNEIYASINDKKGYLYLDSGEYGNYGFTPYGSD